MKRSAEMVPIEHETSDRVVRMVVFALAPAARHGLRRWELDAGAWLIAALERSHLAWDVARISPRRQAAKRGPAVAS